jgi:hypothetical protein
MVNIINCISEDNSLDGIEAGMGSNITGCAVKGNGGNGIEITEPIPATLGELYESYSQIKDCMIYGNTGAGIMIFQYVTVVGNTCSFNNAGIYVDSSGGIFVAPSAAGSAPVPPPGKGNRIEANNVMNNSTNGIYVPANSNSLIIRNWSYGNGTDYNISTTGNTYGPIISGNLGTNDNPHANYTFLIPL